MSIIAAEHTAQLNAA
jgi:hypothetical protein